METPIGWRINLLTRWPKTHFSTGKRAPQTFIFPVELFPKSAKTSLQMRKRYAWHPINVTALRKYFRISSCQKHVFTYRISNCIDGDKITTHPPQPPIFVFEGNIEYWTVSNGLRIAFKVGVRADLALFGNIEIYFQCVLFGSFRGGLWESDGSLNVWNLCFVCLIVCAVVDVVFLGISMDLLMCEFIFIRVFYVVLNSVQHWTWYSFRI